MGPSLMLPFLFKFGSEKGRIAYYIVIGLLCASGVIATGAGFQLSAGSESLWVLALIAGVAIAVYTLSWLLSIAFYKQKEL